MANFEKAEDAKKKRAMKRAAVAEIHGQVRGGGGEEDEGGDVEEGGGVHPDDPIEQWREEDEDPIEECDEEEDSSWDEEEEEDEGDIPIPTSDEDLEKGEEGDEEGKEMGDDEAEEDGEQDGDDEQEEDEEVCEDEEHAEEIPERVMGDGTTWKLVWVRTEGGILAEPVEMVPAKRLRASPRG